MSECKTFHGLTQELFSCVKTRSSQDHGTVYDAPDGDQGTATTDTIVGKVTVSFDFDPSSSAITYCIVRKPLIVSASQVFEGIGDTINRCRSA